PPARPLWAAMVAPHALAVAGRGADPCPRHRQVRLRQVALARRLAARVAAGGSAGDFSRSPRRRHAPLARLSRRRRLLRAAGRFPTAALSAPPGGGTAGSLSAAQLAQPTRRSAPRPRRPRQRSLPPLLAG